MMKIKLATYTQKENGFEITEKKPDFIEEQNESIQNVSQGSFSDLADLDLSDDSSSEEMGAPNPDPDVISLRGRNVVKTDVSDKVWTGPRDRHPTGPICRPKRAPVAPLVDRTPDHSSDSESDSFSDSEDSRGISGLFVDDSFDSSIENVAPRAPSPTAEKTKDVFVSHMQDGTRKIISVVTDDRRTTY